MAAGYVPTSGTRLPPIREVATQLALSPTTVSAGCSLLARAGAIRTDGRRGTTVADPVGPLPVQDEVTALVRLASQGIGVTPGSPFAVLPHMPGHIRVTCGLVATDHDALAGRIAAAANATGWTCRGR